MISCDGAVANSEYPVAAGVQRTAVTPELFAIVLSEIII